MLKQILSKLPRKSLKPGSDEPARGDLASSVESPRAAGRSHRPHGGSSSAAKRASSSAVFPASMVSGIEPMVPFKDVPNAEKMNLFVSKLSLCCVTFDFTEPGKTSADKDVKRKTLAELVDFVACGSMRFSEPAIIAMCRMCVFNLLRVLPPTYRASGGGENDDDEPMFDPAWSHLQLVYELLLQFISSSCLDAKVAKSILITRLLPDCLSCLIQRILGKGIA